MQEKLKIQLFGLGLALAPLSSSAQVFPISRIARSIASVSFETENLSSYVNPLIGTANSQSFDAANSVHGAGGNTYPGATVPFGMVQFGPNTDHVGRFTYFYKDKGIKGFSLTHISGDGCIQSHEIPAWPMIHAGSSSAIPYSHIDEVAQAGYYSVKMENGIQAEFTASSRTGMSRFHFPADIAPTLVIESPLEKGGGLHLVGKNRIEGSVDGGNFCDRGNKFTLYFSMEFDAPILSSVIKGDSITLNFPVRSDRVVRMKAGISYVSEKNARLNLDKESKKWNFHALQKSAEAQWNQLLKKVLIQTEDETKKRIFYTAVYHSFLHPNIFSDVNGEYAGFDQQTHNVPKDHAQYANYSNWDIYRTQIQLLSLLAPAQTSDMVQSLINDGEQCGALPKWPYNNDEAAVMIGDPAVAVIANAYAFGARNFDTASALRLMIKSATDTNANCNGHTARPGLNQYIQYGYIPANTPSAPDSVSTTLEYAIADFSLSEFAKNLNSLEVAATFQSRAAASWRHLYDDSSGFFRPKKADGSWVLAFDANTQDGFTEGNASQYAWELPFDIAGLVKLTGDTATLKHLDFHFTQLNSGERNPHFWIGNEPGFATPWAYLWTQSPQRTNEVLQKIWQGNFFDTPGGLPGNDDLGAMSAWYVWSNLGLYPMVPGVAEFAPNEPSFSVVELRPENGKVIHRVQGESSQTSTAGSGLTGSVPTPVVKSIFIPL